jgi:hypothetical protein
MSRYPTFAENYVKAFETLREIFWEAKRAPTTQHTMLTNPYRREKLIKRFYGKYAEQRKQMRIQLKEAAKMHEQMITIKEQEKLQIESDAKMKHSQKLRGYAKKRRELGFDDEG